MLGRNARLSRRLSGHLANRVALTIVLVLLVLAGLPVAVWLDLRNLSERALREQADDLSTMIDSIRNYYSNNVVGRVLAGDDKTHVIPNYTEIRGAIPIPATLSLELGDLINAGNGNTQFRFFSDYPFKNRAPHAFDAFERGALESLRQDPNSRVRDVSGSIFDRRVRLVTPIIMAAPCVNCHNAVQCCRGKSSFTVLGAEERGVRKTDDLLGFVALQAPCTAIPTHHQPIETNGVEGIVDDRLNEQLQPASIV
jgi:hypothetical protein